MQKNLLIAGGGTGGHVFAGIAVADAFKERFPNAKILFVGSFGGIEEIAVPRAGYELRCFYLGSLVDKGIFKKIKTLMQLPFALLMSAWILMIMRPKVILGVGGYASGPVVLMARFLCWLWLGKTVVLEQNAVSGMTNKILGRLAHLVLIAFPGLESQFLGKKVVLTGNPIRKEIRPLPRARPDPFVIFIFGGSQGAHGVNSLVLEALAYLKDLTPQLFLIHQTGIKDYERVLKGYEQFQISCRVEKFIYNMMDSYEKSSLIICRSGSSTLSELAAVGRAAILIPWPYHSDEQQLKNARIFEKEGAAIILEQLKSNGKDLSMILRRLMSNPSEVHQMEKQVREFYRPNAAKEIVDALVG